MNVLFLCVANSVRSQMAEGLGRKILGDEYFVESAGSQRARVHPYAIQVMSEIGIDISRQTSKCIDVIDLQRVDLVVTLCAEEYCPALRKGARRLHWPLFDPTGQAGTEKEALVMFRTARDEIARRITELKKELEAQS